MPEFHIEQVHCVVSVLIYTLSSHKLPALKSKEEKNRSFGNLSKYRASLSLFFPGIRVNRVRIEYD
jgi:hypothetical protein